MKPDPSFERTLLGLAVRRMRRDRDLSQETVGRAGGLHRNYVGAIERGEVNPAFGVMLKVARGLGAPLSAIVEHYERAHEQTRQGSA